MQGLITLAVPFARLTDVDVCNSRPVVPMIHEHRQADRQPCHLLFVLSMSMIAKPTYIATNNPIGINSISIPPVLISNSEHK